jgi:hypothetical protein
MSNLVVLPPSLIIIFLFRRARPRKLRTSRIDDALKEHGDEKDANLIRSVDSTFLFILYFQELMLENLIARGKSE